MPIYIGTQKIDMSGIEKVYVGTQLVYQKNSIQVLSIAISGATTTFNVGSTWSFGGTVTASYSDGTTANVTNETVFTGYDMSTAGTQTVTASYTFNGTTVTATYSITVYKVLTSITLSGQTTSLSRGASFSFGGTVTAHYNDNSTANVTSSTTFSGYNMSTAGTYTVTASYTYRNVTKTATYSLTVTKAWSTVWSGSKTVKVVTKTITGAGNVYTLTGSSKQIRLTFTMSTSGGDSNYDTRYFTYSSSSTTGSMTWSKPSSPYSVTLSHTNTSNAYRVLACTKYRDSSYNAIAGVTAKYNGSQYVIALAGWTGTNTPVSGTTAQLTLTKIEQYY